MEVATEADGVAVLSPMGLVGLPFGMLPGAGEGRVGIDSW